MFASIYIMTTKVRHASSINHAILHKDKEYESASRIIISLSGSWNSSNINSQKSMGGQPQRSRDKFTASVSVNVEQNEGKVVEGRLQQRCPWVSICTA